MVESARALAPAAPQHAQGEWWTLRRRGMGGRRVWWVFVRRGAPRSASSGAAHPRPPAGGSAAADRCRELGSSGIDLQLSATIATILILLPS